MGITALRASWPRFWPPRLTKMLSDAPPWAHGFIGANFSVAAVNCSQEKVLRCGFDGASIKTKGDLHNRWARQNQIT